MLETVLGFVAVLALALAGMQIGFALFIVGLVGFSIVIGWSPALAMVGQISWESAQNYGFSVLPLFILMGNILNKARLSNELYEASNAFLGHKRGGLAMATIVACGGFSAICGSSLATVVVVFQPFAVLLWPQLPRWAKCQFHPCVGLGMQTAWPLARSRLEVLWVF